MKTIEEKILNGRTCFLYGTAGPSCSLLIQPVSENGLESLESELRLIEEYTGGKDFALAALLIKDWNAELTPWEAPPAFGNEAFGSGAAETLRFIEEELIPELLVSGAAAPLACGAPLSAPASDPELPDAGGCAAPSGASCSPKIFLGGYSLAGLFALWAAYSSRAFSGAAGVSPSVWYPGWPEFTQTHELLVPRIYLSLGDREERTKNKLMSRSGDNIRSLFEQLKKDPRCEDCALEWNPGNHFADHDIRMAKGFAWLLT
ncbi:MAG: esterase [Firmicutes bacterium]|nr:esterase [Bacillota bacterium]